MKIIKTETKQRRAFLHGAVPLLFFILSRSLYFTCVKRTCLSMSQISFWIHNHHPSREIRIPTFAS